MTYLRRHWRGELSLARSFWVNIVLIDLALALLILWMNTSEIGLWIVRTVPVPPGGLVVIACASLGILTLQLVLVTPWQLVGCWRSANRRIAETGKSIVGFLVKRALILVLAYAIATLWAHIDHYRLTLKGSSGFSTFEVSILPELNAIEVWGDIGAGLTSEVRTALEQAPDTTALILESDGGHTIVGEQLGALIEQEGLDTFSFGRCHSACTLAFIGGNRRYLGPAATLGFHQFRGPTDDYQNNATLDRLQELTEKRFRRRGVAHEFTTRMFRAGGNDMWYPNHDLLRRTDVIHGLIPRSQLAADSPLPAESEADGLRKHP